MLNTISLPSNNMHFYCHYCAEVGRDWSAKQSSGVV